MSSLQTNHSHVTISFSFSHSPTFTSLQLDEREQLNSRLPASTQSIAAERLTLWICGMAWASMECGSPYHSPRATTRHKTVPSWGLTGAVSLLQSRMPTTSPCTCISECCAAAPAHAGPTGTNTPQLTFSIYHTTSHRLPPLPCWVPPATCETHCMETQEYYRASGRRTLAPVNL